MIANFLKSLGLTRDSALWFWGEVLSVATFIASGVLDLQYWATYIGISLTTTEVHRIAVAAFILCWFSGRYNTSVLPGRNDPPAGSVKTSTLKPVAGVMLAIALGAMVAGTSACAKNPAPTTSPAVISATQAQRAIAVLDVLRDTAVSMNAQTPKLLSDHATTAIVNAHESIVKIITAAPSGWKAAAQAGLNELSTTADLTPAEHAAIAPYVVVAAAALAAVN